MRSIFSARSTLAVRPVALFASAVLFVLAAPVAHAWSPPTAIYVNGDSKAYAVAGDPTGNAFAVVGGGTLDEPLVLVERDAISASSSRPSFDWGGAQPLPQLPAPWTVSGLKVGAAAAAAAGDGAGLIAIRWDTGSSSLVSALVRDDAALGFAAPPVALVGARFSPMSRPAAGISDGGLAVVAIGTADPRTKKRRVAIVTRLPGLRFGVPRFFASRSLSQPSVGIGTDGSPVAAWVTGHKAVASRIADNGVPQRPQLLGAARPGAPIAAAVGRLGNGIVAWEDADGSVRVVRRSSPGRLSLSLPLSAGGNEQVRNVGAAVDERGRAFVTWRIGADAATRIVVAQAAVGAAFKLATLGQGAGLGAPAITARPGGGAAVIWSAPKGWQAAKAPRNGVFTATSTVSAPLQGGDGALATGAAIAGPGPSVDIIWRQFGVEAPADGINLFQSQDDQP